MPRRHHNAATRYHAPPITAARLAAASTTWDAIEAILAAVKQNAPALTGRGVQAPPRSSPGGSANAGHNPTR